MTSQAKRSLLKRVPLLVMLAALFSPTIRQLSKSGTLTTAAYLFGLAFLICFLISPLTILICHSIGLVDKPDEARKQHRHAVPLSGGLALFFAFAITILINFHFSFEMKAILIGGALIFIMGIIDDRFKLSARIRLAVQIGVSLYLVLSGVRITFVPDFLGGIYTEGIITIVWLIGITNSMNFIDGMDGLAGGTVVIYSIFFAIIAAISGQFYLMYLAIALGGSTLGFLPYNLRFNRPALVFLGDGGSTFLGFLLASFALLGEWGASVTDLVIPILIMSILIFDMTLTTIVRIYSGEVTSFSEWIHFTGRDHVHHRLTAVGLSKTMATLVFFLISISFGLEALVLMFADVWSSLIILTHTIIAFFILGILLVSKTTSS